MPTLQPMEGVTHGELLKRAAGNDQTAWNALVDRFGSVVWSIARSFGLDEATAKDVSQTVWLKLVENLDRIEDPERLDEVAAFGDGVGERPRRLDEGLVFPRLRAQLLRTGQACHRGEAPRRKRGERGGVARPTLRHLGANRFERCVDVVRLRAARCSG